MSFLVDADLDIIQSLLDFLRIEVDILEKIKYNSALKYDLGEDTYQEDQVSTGCELINTGKC